MLKKSLNTHVKGDSRDNLITDLLSKMPDTTAFEDLPELHLSASAPQPGAPRLTRASSKGAAGGMGIAENKRKSIANRANQLVKIIDCFMGFD